jgi:hypothetical protein
MINLQAISCGRDDGVHQAEGPFTFSSAFGHTPNG